MAELVRVLVSSDRRWRVEIDSDRRASVYDHGHPVLRIREYELRDRLAELGVNLDELVED